MNHLAVHFQPRRIISIALILAVLPLLPGIVERPSFGRTIINLGRSPVAGLFIREFGGAAHAEDGSIFNAGSDQVTGMLDQYFQQVDSAIGAGDIRIAKQKLSFIDFKLQKHKDLFDKSQRKAYAARSAAQNAGVKRIIDSLVQINLSVVRTSGRSAGIDYRRELAARGLTEDQLAPVDEAIVNASPSEENAPPPPRPEPARVRRQQEQAQEIPVAPPKPEPVAEKIAPPPERPRAPEPPAVSPQQEFPRPVETPPPPPPADETPVIPWPDMDDAPPGKPSTSEPPAPVDEVEQKGQASADANASKIILLLDQGKCDEAMTVFQVYRHNLQKFMPAYAFEKLKSSVETAYAQDQNRRAEATRLLRTIDDLVDQDRSAEAFDLLRRQRTLLQQCLEKEEFARLEEKVGRASVDFGKAQAVAHAKAREIRTLLAENTHEAMMLFERERDELKRCLPRDAFEELRRDVEKIEAGIRDKRKRSQLCRRDILVLIGEGKGAEALAQFAENKPLLEGNLDRKEFSSLAAAATAANNEFYLRQAKAQAGVQRIDSLIASKKIEQARDFFVQHKDSLRGELNDDKRFFDLKDRVRTAYDDFTKKRKKAAKSIKKINSLVSRNEGREAHLLFLQDAGVIREYLDSGTYAKLEEDVKNAAINFEAGMIAARKMASGIDALLKQRRFEQAFTTFKATRDTFDHYLEDDDAIEALGKRTDSSFSAYRKHKRWAADMVEDIQWHIDENKGPQAGELYEKMKPELSLYLEGAVMKSLDSAVVAGEKNYLAAKSLAEKNVKRLGKLLDRKRFEDAYTLFKELRSSMEPYLQESTFSNLRNEVTNAYEELQDKKNRARDYADELKDLVWDKKFKEAKQGFQENRKSLKQYLDAQTYAELEKTVMNAAPAKKASAKPKTRKGK